MLGFIVLAVLAVLIFIGLKNKKELAAEQQKAAAEKKAAEEKAAAEKKAKAAAVIKERFNAEFEKMWANLENNPNSYGAECQKLKDRLGIEDIVGSYGRKEDDPLFATSFKNAVKEKIYSRNSSAKFIIGSLLEEDFKGLMQRAYSRGELKGHLIGFVMCANRFEKFTGNYTDYPKLSDEEISNFIVNETSFPDNSASSLIASVRKAIENTFWLDYSRFGRSFFSDEFTFDFACSAAFSACFDGFEYKKGNSDSMIDCIYNNIPITTRYWFCKNFDQYFQVDLTHMMYNHDAAFSAMLNHYGFTRADRVADVPRGTKGFASEFDGRNC